MRTSYFRFAALAVAMLALSSLLSAQGWGGGRGRMGARGAFMGLKLTADQQTQMKAIRERHEAAFKAKGEVAKGAFQALRAAMLKPDTDTKTLQALHEKVAAAQFDLMIERRAMRQEMAPILTADQKALIEKRMEAMSMGPRGRRGAGQGKGMGMGPDCPMNKQ
jgi:Spy/CpxP family protein refolding chaperone